MSFTTDNSRSIMLKNMFLDEGQFKMHQEWGEKKIVNIWINKTITDYIRIHKNVFHGF